MTDLLTIEEFRAFRDHLREYCGLSFSDDKHARVAGVLASRMRELGIGSFPEYFRLLKASAGTASELSRLADLLIVGETHFLRNKHHWRAFRQCVLPWIVERNLATGQRHIRIWSAGCSTGEEAYTAAMVMTRNLPDPDDWNVEIIGTDISSTAIETARRAVYTKNSFRGVPAGIKEEFFEEVENGRYAARDDIRRMVRFGELNLLDEAAMAKMRDFDVVFCRNVLIYFDKPATQYVLDGFHRSLKPDGYLFLGHSETAQGNSSGFASVNVCDTFIYKSVPYAGGRPRPASRPRPLDVTSPGVLQPENRSERADRHDERPVTANAPPAPVETRDLSWPASIDTAAADSSLQAIVPPSPPVAPAAPAEGEQTSSEGLREQAVEKLLAEQYGAAQQVLESLVQQDADDSESVLLLALALANTNHGEEALECAQRVLRQRPFCAEAYCVMALVHEGLGDDATALAELDKAIYLDEGFSVAHFRLAGLHNRAGRKAAALRELANTAGALPADEEQRVRLYSGGFSSTLIAQVCERRLGVESVTGPGAAPEGPVSRDGREMSR